MWQRAWRKSSVKNNRILTVESNLHNLSAHALRLTWPLQEIIIIIIIFLRLIIIIIIIIIISVIYYNTVTFSQKGKNNSAKKEYTSSFQVKALNEVKIHLCITFWICIFEELPTLVTMDTVLIPLYINLKLKDLSFKIKMVLLFSNWSFGFISLIVFRKEPLSAQNTHWRDTPSEKDGTCTCRVIN